MDTKDNIRIILSKEEIPIFPIVMNWTKKETTEMDITKIKWAIHPTEMNRTGFRANKEWRLKETTPKTGLNLQEWKANKEWNPKEITPKTGLNLQEWQANKEPNPKEITPKTGLNLQEWKANKEWNPKEIIPKTGMNPKELPHRKEHKQEARILRPEIWVMVIPTLLPEAPTRGYKTLKFNLKHGSFDRVFFIKFFLHKNQTYI